MNKLDILALTVLTLILWCLTALIVINGYKYNMEDKQSLECVYNCKYYGL